MQPSEIESLFQSRGARDASEGTNVSKEDQDQRTASLQPVLATVQRLWWPFQPELDLVAEKLADGSRDDAWRLPLGESGILDAFLSIIQRDGLGQALKIHALRLIGNACADKDENRARVVSSNALSSIVMLLADDTLLAFVIPVLYNILVDYEPAQKKAREHDLSRRLIDLLWSDRIQACMPFVGIAGKILALLVTHEEELATAYPATPLGLLRLVTRGPDSLDVEDANLLTTVALAYFANPRFQYPIVDANEYHALLTAFSLSYRAVDTASEPEDIAQLKQLHNAFVQVLADISDLPNFATVYPIRNPVHNTMRRWLELGQGYSHLETAACLVFGNLARSDAASTSFVQEFKVHRHLVRLLEDPYPAHNGVMPSQLTHAILSFLKNLSIAVPNKPIIGSALLESVLPRLWNTTDTQPQVQFSAVSLARLLVTNCPSNTKLICNPLSADPSSPANNRTNLHVLAALHRRVDAEPTKAEAARAVLAVCRMLQTHSPLQDIIPVEWSAPPGEELDDDTDEDAIRRGRFYAAHPQLNDPLSYLITQRFPSLRSEAWFVLALMSRTTEGSGVVARAIQPLEIVGPLTYALTGREDYANSNREASRPTATAKVIGGLSDGREGAEGSLEQLGLAPQQADVTQAAGMAKVDRENCLIMLTQVLAKSPLEIPPLRRDVYEALAKEGSEIIAQDKSL